MLHNPAYLANEAIAFEFADAQIVLPSTAKDVLAYKGINNSTYFYDADRHDQGQSQIYNASKLGYYLLMQL